VSVKTLAYYSAATDAGLSCGPDSLGLRRRVFVAPSDAEAQGTVESCDDPMGLSCKKCSKTIRTPSLPCPAARRRQTHFLTNLTIIVGSPETVTEQLVEQVKNTGSTRRRA
jgi:alkanesulfonate monooxygenase SsuD/methylene tetrahydromethanopterin reductase-like flavin-dependent oxidoreductase (luciferase family)